MLGLCDRLAVLNFGQRISLGNPDQVRRDPAVIEAYLGGTP
jgi:branched-chain amino acid transport system ATP-binding protein